MPEDIARFCSLQEIMTSLRNESTPEERAIWQKVDEAAERAPQYMRDKISFLCSQKKFFARNSGIECSDTVYFSSELGREIHATLSKYISDGSSQFLPYYNKLHAEGLTASDFMGIESLALTMSDFWEI